MREGVARGRALRIGRVSEQGRIYLVTTVVQARRPVFRDWQLGRLLVNTMRQAEQQRRVESLAWVIMPEHLHWLFRLTDGALGELMRDVKSQSGRLVNQTACLSPPLWQAGYHDHAVRHDEDLLAMARYVVANPLRAGLVQRVGDYPLWDAAWL
ncbi:transposase [Pseudomonas stutzeri]|uniref:Transposase n=1 Tax=Stutzerimonas stutzeri KOS6 TaxID=1218352 RepID=A0A061JKW7_STUST|nr:transposase [Stutzerimonas stutzeri]EWC38935.1 transposase [Stutzerimonas stutzeri KOS6]MBK3866169.1 transposase [Stutzerimonas stutzeri]